MESVEATRHEVSTCALLSAAIATALEWGANGYKTGQVILAHELVGSLGALKWDHNNSSSSSNSSSALQLLCHLQRAPATQSQGYHYNSLRLSTQSKQIANRPPVSRAPKTVSKPAAQ